MLAIIFKIKENLNVKDLSVNKKKFKYDPEIHCETTFINELCDTIYDSNCCEFYIQFKKNKYKRNIDYDLPRILQNADEFFKIFNYGFGKCSFNFFESGYSSDFIFEIDEDDESKIHIYNKESSATIEYGESETITMQTKDIIKMFENIRDTFYELASHMYPSITNHPAFKEWYKKLFIEYYD